LIFSTHHLCSSTMWGNAVSSCHTAAVLQPATQKRLLADLKRLHEEPVPLAAAAPCSDADLSLWNGIIGINMEVTHFGTITVPLHFLIDFPSDYPQSAPNIGFSFEFQYRGGAEYTMPNGRLKGKKVICLDILGNFGGVHTEWKSTVGSGWSPAYTVTTLLIQLQSVLCDVGIQMCQQQRDQTYQSAMRFAERHPDCLLELLDEDDVRDLREERSQKQTITKVCGGDDALAARLHSFAKRSHIASNSAHMQEFLSLLVDVARGCAASTSVGSGTVSPLSADVDENICCFSTGKLYTEALLGVGVLREKNNLGTAGELLSKEAFDTGLRQSTNKSAFEFFLPVWINSSHSEKSQDWRLALRDNCRLIGKEVYNVTGDDERVMLEIFPRLINQLIVEMMKPDAPKSEAIATFEAMANFWRVFRYLVDGRPSLQQSLCKTLTKFVKDENMRHKDVTPDVGALLVMYTVCQGFEGCPARSAFIQAYSDESSLRQVMWWQRSSTAPKSQPVFEATKVSRNLLMFQLAVVDIVLGDVEDVKKQIELTNCKLPERLEKLQTEWRKRKELTDTWPKYFKAIGAPTPPFPSTDAWIQSCVQRAAEKGPRYGGAGKGAGKGKSKGKYGTRF